MGRMDFCASARASELRRISRADGFVLVPGVGVASRPSLPSCLFSVFLDLMIPYPCSFLINNSYISKTSRDAVHIEMVSINRTDKVDKKIIITRFILFSGKANGTFPGWMTSRW